MNDNEISLVNKQEKYKELEIQYIEVVKENTRLKSEIIKLKEKYDNELKKIKEENNGLKSEIMKLQKKIDNEQINEINNSKLEEKDYSFNSSFDSNKKEKSQSLLSTSINDILNSLSFNNKEVAIEKLISYSGDYLGIRAHFVCQGCNQVPRIKFIDLNKFKYTCRCHEDENLGIGIIKDKFIVEENGKIDIIKYLKCQIHQKKYHYFCQYCKINLCRKCLSEHRYHDFDIFDSHTLEANEMIYYISSILDDDSKKLNMEEIEYNIVNEILFLFSIIAKDFIYYPNYSHFKIFENALTFFKTFFSNADNNKIIESLEIGKKYFITYKKSLLQILQNKDNVHSIFEIKITKNNFNDISELCKLDLINLEKLVLTENCISDIEPLVNANFKNIKVIDLELNRIGDDNIPHLFKLKFGKLKEINLYLNNFTDPSIFEFKNGESEKNLPNLKVFFLGNNKINWNLKKDKNINYNFSELKSIGLSCGLFDENTISYLKNFNFKNLEKIFLSRNNIYSLSFVKNLELPNIKEFYINSTYIKEFYSLVKYETLEKIGLRENYINNIDNLESFIKKLPKLKYIGLERNDIDMNEEKNKKIIDSIHKNENSRCINILI